MIYDCFTFYNELDLLRLRLRLLAPVVDRFVLVEMDRTQTGLAKPMFFAEHREEFREYLDKIIYVPVTDTPDFAVQYDNWLLENYQRNAILRGLRGCQADDIIIVSDLDEIPRPEILAHLADVKCSLVHGINNNLKDRVRNIYSQLAYTAMLLPRLVKQRELSALALMDITPVILEQYIHYYFLNCRARGFLHGSVMMRYRALVLPHSCRNLRHYLPVVRDGGWHFSYMGGRAMIKNKLRSIVEGGLMPEVTELDAYIDDCLASGRDLFGRVGNDYRYEFIAPEAIGLPDIAGIMRDYPQLFSTDHIADTNVHLGGGKAQP